MALKRVLFLCSGNSARSQMAEALLNSMEVHVAAVSAGIAPVGYVHPLAVKVMAERGVNIALSRSKPGSEFLGQQFDLVITVCDTARQACPSFPGAREQRNWDIPDPVVAVGTDEEQLAAFRATRDLLAERLTEEFAE